MWGLTVMLGLLSIYSEGINPCLLPPPSPRSFGIMGLGGGIPSRSLSLKDLDGKYFEINDLARSIRFAQDFGSGLPLLHPVTQKPRAGDPGSLTPAKRLNLARKLHLNGFGAASRAVLVDGRAANCPNQISIFYRCSG